MSLSDAPDNMRDGFTILGNPAGSTGASIRDHVDANADFVDPFALIRTIRADIQAETVVREQGGQATLLTQVIK